MTTLELIQAQAALVAAQAAGVDAAGCEALAEEIAGAGRIFVGGAGRTLLVMKMFAMRLMQTNHTAYLVGEVCTPAIAAGDLLIVGSGSGGTNVTLAVVRKAKAKGARTALVTANAKGSIAAEADVVLCLPAAAKPAAADAPATAFVKANQPGNLFETACLFVLDGLISRLMVRDGLTADVVMQNHANLE